MLRVRHGAFTDLEASFLEEFRESRERDPLAPAVVVAPTRSLLTRLKRRIAETRPRGTLNVSYLTLYGLAQRMLELHPAPRPIETDGALLELLCRESMDVEEPFAAIQDFREAALTREAYRQWMEETEPSEDDREDLERLLPPWKRYEDRLAARKIWDRSDAFREADETARGAETLPWSSIWIHGVYDLNGVQSDFLEELLRKSDAAWFFPYLPDDPAYAYGKRLFESRLVQGLAAETVRVPAAGRKHPLPGLRSASGAEGEIWIAAKEVTRLLDSGAPADRIAVVARDLSAYQEELVRTFGEHAIPLLIRRRGADARGLLARTVRLLFRLAERDFPRPDLMRLLRSPLFRLDGAGEPGLLDAWDRITRKLGIPGGAGLWRERLAWAADPALYRELTEEKEAPDPLLVVEPLRSAVARALDAIGALPASASWPAWAAALRALRDGLLAVPEGDAETGAAWERLDAALDGLERMGTGLPKADRAAVLKFLERQWLAGSAPETGGDGVQALDALEARGLAFDHVVLLGLNEKSFPRLIHEDPWLRDAWRQKIAATLGVVLSEKLNGYDEERLLFRFCAEAAGESLTLVWQRSDDEGNARVHSHYLTPWKPEELPAGSAAPRGILERLDLLIAEGGARRLLPREARLLPASRRHPKAEDPFLAESLTAIRRIETLDGPLAEFDGLLGDGAPVWEALRKKHLSPSAWESLGRCPFQFMARYVLRLEPPEFPEEQTALSPLWTGSFVHDVLCGVYRRLFPDGKKGDAAAWRAALAETLDAQVRAYKRRYPAYPLLWDAERSYAQRGLAAFVERDLAELERSGAAPWMLEDWLRSAGFPSEDGIPLRGKIDRLDLEKSDGAWRYRAYDYKTGKPRAGKVHEHALQGVQWQLPLYLKMAEEELRARIRAGTLEDLPLLDAGGAYLHIGHGDDDGTVLVELEPGFWKSHGAAAEKTARRLLALVREGTFFPAPDPMSEGSYCRYCDFSAICRKGHPMSAYRREADERSRDYEGIRKTKPDAPKGKPKR